MARYVAAVDHSVENRMNSWKIWELAHHASRGKSSGCCCEQIKLLGGYWKSLWRNVAAHDWREGSVVTCANGWLPGGVQLGS
ncbi:hypothetical protein Scep_027960 [Stephania cephalantha]|uniref:Uncharacterized protein n=1 Tax=Stephania cephalantha TaxID=152367 RepID=A0AAP0EC79_9MAGN